jgi:hypothetical protein
MRKDSRVLLLLLVLSAPAAGRDIFVDNAGGDDRSSGQQAKNVVRNGPVRTIAKALRLAGGGDRIVLAATGQPYRESLGIAGPRLSGTARQPLVIVGNGAVLDGSAPVPVEQWKHVGGGVYRYHPPQMGFQQLFVDDRRAARVSSGSLSGRPPKLEPRQWCTFQGDILFRVEKGKMPADYALTCAALQTGITLYQVEHVTISGLTVQRFAVDGVNALNSARNVRLSAVVCRDNGRYGIDVGGASLVDIDSCLSSGNGAAGLLTSAYSETHVRQSRLPGDTAPGWVDQGGRVYIGTNLVEGGRDSVAPRDAPPPAAGKNAAADKPSRAPSP